MSQPMYKYIFIIFYINMHSNRSIYYR